MSIVHIADITMFYAPASGGVRAYYGGDKGSGYYDYAAALHPAASTFKPIVLAAEGFAPQVIDAIDALTKRPGEE